jgi:glycosyltransferase involved in cell wall biosynthesis
VSEPFFSVVMPVYNGGRYVRRALESLEGQRGFDGGFEVIAADDASTDDSRAILDSFAGRLPLRIIGGACKGNWVASTNKALGGCRGRFVCFLHQDDAFAPDKFARVKAAAEANPGVPLVTHAIGYIGPKGENLGGFFQPFAAGRHNAAYILPRLLAQNVVMVPGTAFARQALEKIGPLDEGLRYTADWDFWLRLALAGDVLHLRGTLAFFRIHPDSQTVGFAEKQAEYAENLRRVVDRFAPAADNLLSPRAARRCRAVAELGIQANIFLSSRGTGGSAPWTPVLKAAAGAGLVGSMQYLLRSHVVARSLARIHAGIHGKRSRRQDA